MTVAKSKHQMPVHTATEEEMGSFLKSLAQNKSKPATLPLISQVVSTEEVKASNSALD